MTNMIRTMALGAVLTIGVTGAMAGQGSTSKATPAKAPATKAVNMTKTKTEKMPSTGKTTTKKAKKVRRKKAKHATASTAMPKS